MTPPLEPRESGKFIAENSKDVFVELKGVHSLAETLLQKIGRKEITLKGWKILHELNPRGSGEDSVNWVFFADTLNFSFWAENQDKKYLVEYKGKTYSGYWSFCAAINRALDEGIPITTPSYYSKMTLEQLQHVFRSDTDVPMTMIETRLEILHQTGNTLMEKFGGSFLNCVKKSQKSAVKLMQLVVENFPSYRDEGVFQGQKVSIYKRAQILVGDVWGVLEGKGDGCFTDIDKITMFADYRVPQALVHFGVLRYSEELLKKLKEVLGSLALLRFFWSMEPSGTETDDEALHWGQ
ncbi:queuosine 5'-phosphate N-glycosylase/hydrolase-like isoform X2 [Hyperolius riggenbachi]|uniref:queuosine 5'-phosphate N-glycosylase/hydrolase-like isoform X2 n=1 Tax=Hyperolius riggenbachi TaxID=752182 RepID=UPI0035A3204E